MSYSAEILGDSPVLYYRLGSGASITDAAGNYNGSYLNAPATAPGVLIGDGGDLARQFVGASFQNASSDNDITQANAAAAFTIEAWVKIPSGGIARFGFGTTDQTAFNIAIGETSCGIIYGDGTNVSFPSFTLSASNDWRHVVLVFDGSQTGWDRLKVYVNGVLQTLTPGGTSPATTLAATPGRFYIGWKAGEYSTATIDEAAAYNRVLTTTEIQSHIANRGVEGYFLMEDGFKFLLEDGSGYYTTEVPPTAVEGEATLSGVATTSAVAEVAVPGTSEVDGRATASITVEIAVPGASNVDGRATTSVTQDVSVPGVAIVSAETDGIDYASIVDSLILTEHYLRFGNASESGTVVGSDNIFTTGLLVNERNGSRLFTGESRVELASTGYEQFTIDFWFRISSTSSSVCLIAVSDDDLDTTFSNQIRFDANDDTLQFSIVDINLDENVLYSMEPIVQNVVYHVTATAYNDGYMRLYLNGELQGEALIGTMWAGADKWHIGKGSPTQGLAGFVGEIDELFIASGQVVSPTGVRTLQLAGTDSPEFTHVVPGAVTSEGVAETSQTNSISVPGVAQVNGVATTDVDANGDVNATVVLNGITTTSATFEVSVPGVSALDGIATISASTTISVPGVDILDGVTVATVTGIVSVPAVATLNGVATTNATQGGGGASYTDNFNRTNSNAGLGTPSGSPNPWLTSGGFWGIIDQQGYLDGASGHSIAFMESSQSDANVQITFNVFDAGSKLVLRYVDDNNYIRVNVSVDTLNVRQYVAGSDNFLGFRDPIDINNGDTIRAVIEGTTLNVYVNGTLVPGGSFTVTSSAGTKHGFGLGGSLGRVDNFVMAGLGNANPDKPTITPGAPDQTSCALSSSAYNDFDGDAHSASQWQVTLDTDTSFASPVISTGDVTGANLLAYTASGLDPGEDYICRVRHKDAVSNYSAWSDSEAFTTTTGPDVTPPTIPAGFTTNVAGTQSTATISEAGCVFANGLTSMTGALGTLNNTAATITGASISGTTLTLTHTPISMHESGITFDLPANSIKDAADNWMVSFSGKAVNTSAVTGLYINIGLGQEKSISSNLDVLGTITIIGQGPTSVLNFNGFQIKNVNGRKSVTLTNFKVYNSGQPLPLTELAASTYPVTGSTGNGVAVVLDLGESNVPIADGHPVWVKGIVGNTAANVVCWAKVSTVTGTQVALYQDRNLTNPVIGNGAYVSGGSLIDIQNDKFNQSDNSRDGLWLEFDSGQTFTLGGLTFENYARVHLKFNGTSAVADSGGHTWTATMKNFEEPIKTALASYTNKYVTPDLHRSPLHIYGLNASVLKTFTGHHFQQGGVVLENCYNFRFHHNKFIGDRAGIGGGGCSNVEIDYNYVHVTTGVANSFPWSPNHYGSQVNTFSFYNSVGGVVGHHNVINGGQWAVRNFQGEFHHNVVTSRQAHDLLDQTWGDIDSHHNIWIYGLDAFSQNAIMQIVSTGGGTFNHDTVVSGSDFGSRIAAIHFGRTAKFSNCLFFDPYTVDGLRESIIGGAPLENEPVASGERERLRVGTNYNAFWYPNATPGTTRYANLLEEGGGTPGANDLNGVDPQFAGGPPPLTFPYNDADIISGAVTVESMLADYRDDLAPTNVAYATADSTGTKAPGAVTMMPVVECYQRQLHRLINAAVDNTTQWQSMVASTSIELNKIVSGDYNAGHSALSLWCAGRYHAEKALGNTSVAQSWGDKAIAVMLQAIRDYNTGGRTTLRRLVRGDGSTTVFNFGQSGVVSSTFKVFLPTIVVATMTRAASGDLDTGGQLTTYIDYHSLKVSNTSDGPADYVEGVDWQRTGEEGTNQIKWISANRPAASATYYITMVRPDPGSPISSGNWTLNTSAQTVTFNTAPTANQVVYVEYLYTGVPAGGTTSLAEQMSGYGFGGFHNIFTDAGYVSRNYWFVAASLDWMWDYARFDSALKTEIMTMLVRWANHLRDNGYYKNSPASNYGTGHYRFRAVTAAALATRDGTNGPGLVTDITSWRTTYVLPYLLDPQVANMAVNGSQIGTLYGGAWPEGWGYGAQAVRNLLGGSDVLEQAGHIAAFNEEKAWASDVVKANFCSTTQRDQRFAYGDAADPLAPLDRLTLSMLAEYANNTTMAANARYAITNYATDPGDRLQEALFYEPGTETDWTSGLPLLYHSAGMGITFARSSWTYATATSLAFLCGNLNNADHQSYAQGQLTLFRGDDYLLCNAANLGGDQAPLNKSLFGNVVIVDDHGAGEQTYANPGRQGVWYGDPGIPPMKNAVGATYDYMSGDWAKAYGHNSMTGNPASEGVRSVLFVRSAGYVIVYDRATTTNTSGSYDKISQWFFTVAPSVSGDEFSVAVGASKLFGKTFADAALTTAATGPLAIGSANVHKVAVQHTANPASVRRVTAFQTAPSATSAMDTTARIISGDSRLEGVKIGNSVAMFGRSGIVSGGSISYSVTAGGSDVVTHYVTDLQPSTTYELTNADQTTASSSDKGILTFTTTGSQTVSLAEETGETVDGDAIVSGVATVSATTTITVPAVAAADGVASTSATAIISVPGVSDANGVASTSFTATITVPGVSAVDGVATATQSNTVSVPGVSELAGVATTQATADNEVSGTASVDGRATTSISLVTISVPGATSSDGVATVALTSMSIAVPGTAAVDGVATTSVQSGNEVLAEATASGVASTSITSVVSVPGFSVASGVATDSVVREISIPAITTAAGVTSTDTQIQVSLTGATQIDVVGATLLSLLVSVPGVAESDGRATASSTLQVFVPGATVSSGVANLGLTYAVIVNGQVVLTGVTLAHAQEFASELLMATLTRVRIIPLFWPRNVDIHSMLKLNKADVKSTMKISDVDIQGA